MSPSPCIVFSAFRSATDPRLRGWIAFRHDVHAEPRLPDIATDAHGRPRKRAGAAPGPDSGHAGIWRLLAPNSRELGRSSSVYSSFAGARAHVLELKDQVDDMVATTVTGPTAGTHGWIVTLDGVVVMTAGRWYGAASSSREAAAGTLRAFRNALVPDDPRHSAESGRRSSRVLTEAERALSW